MGTDTQINRVGYDSEIDPHICGQPRFDVDFKMVLWGKGGLSPTNTEKNWISVCDRMT